jgi:hypothetical protein
MQLGSAVDNGVRHQVALAICAAGHSIHGSSPLFRASNADKEPLFPIGVEGFSGAIRCKKQ